LNTKIIRKRMIELKGRYNKDCKIFADDIEESRLFIDTKYPG
jgi:hypothetical protein